MHSLLLNFRGQVMRGDGLFNAHMTMNSPKFSLLTDHGEDKPFSINQILHTSHKYSSFHLHTRSSLNRAILWWLPHPFDYDAVLSWMRSCIATFPRIIIPAAFVLLALQGMCVTIIQIGPDVSGLPQLIFPLQTRHCWPGRSSSYCKIAISRCGASLLVISSRWRHDRFRISFSSCWS